jgi:hypothetical protein
LFEKYAITIAQPQGVPFFYQIGLKDENLPATWAMVEHSLDNKAAFLWFICTPEKMRRKGFARDMIRVLQTRYEFLETQYTEDIINSPGVRLCLSCGFKPVRSLSKKMPSRLVWRRLVKGV